MQELVRWIVSMVARRLRSRAAVELENLALRHQLHVLRRQRPGRPRLFAIDRLLWVWLYRIWPRCLDAMVLVKPATVVQWHRQGFRLFWRWRSKSGRPSVDRKIRALIRLCLPKTLSGMTGGWAYGNEAADGRVSDPAAACYPVAVYEPSAA